MSSPLFEYCVDSHGHRHLFEEATEFLQRRLEEAPKDHGYGLVWDILGATICIGFVALISGLFMGLMTMDPLDLHIIMRVGSTEEEVEQASQLLPIVKDHHRVLVTLLLLNAVAYETLPLFIDNLVPRVWAVVLSVSFVLFFGEIVPCAIFIGPNQLELASKLVPVMHVFLKFTYPLAYPLSKLLDKIVGTETHDDTQDHYNREELSALIRIQHEERTTSKKNRKVGFMANHHKTHQAKIVKKDQRTWRALKKEIMEAVQERAEEQGDDELYDDIMSEDQLNPPLQTEEINMVEGALSMKTKLAMDVYTPLRMIYAIPHDLVLDRENLMLVYSEGYSRIPVYRHQPHRPDDISSIIGLLMTRHLMVIDWDDQREAISLPLQQPPCVSPRMNLVKLITLLKDQGSHMAFVCARPDVADQALDNHEPIPVEAGFMGLITLEDVLEELIQDRIFDELDVRDREREAARLTRWAATKLQEWYKKKKRLRDTQLLLKKQGSFNNNWEEKKAYEGMDVENGLGNSTATTPLLEHHAGLDASEGMRNTSYGST